MINSLKKRITIQKSNLKKDENGNHILEWRDYYNCFAYVNNLSGSEYYEAARTNRQNDLYFVIRYSSEVKKIDSEHYRIVFDGEIYNITFVDNVLYKNETIKLRVSKEATNE